MTSTVYLAAHQLLLRLYTLTNIGLARISLGLHFFRSKKLRTHYSRRLKTQPKTAKLTTPTLQIFPAQQKFVTLALPGVHLQLSPVNYNTLMTYYSVSQKKYPRHFQL